MPRPIRIEYENAFYHVMNRGGGRQVIFTDDRYYRAFLKSLEESHYRFDAVFHAYCLMDNHYHLLVETPRANLGRIMRHINGVYTQRYNQLKQTDGPLFRGRYKAILVDKDAYLLQLSRYIHRNPVETKKPMISQLEDWIWSSYPAYVNYASAPEWLCRELIYRVMGEKQRFAAYKNYVAQGIDTDTATFYNKGNTSLVLGDADFKERLIIENEKLDVDVLKQEIRDRPGIQQIVAAVAQVYEVSPDNILKRKQGRQASNPSRKLAMFCSQNLADMKLEEIAMHFGLKGTGGVSAAIFDIRSQLATGAMAGELAVVKKILKLIK